MLEEYADSIEQPDPVPLVLLPTREIIRSEPEDSNAGSDCGQRLGDDGPDKAGDGGRRHRESSPTRSAQSTDSQPAGPMLDKKVRT